MGRKQKEKTYIKSIRVNEDIKEFLESLENANIFVLQLLEDSNKFKKFVANKKNDNMTESKHHMTNFFTNIKHHMTNIKHHMTNKSTSSYYKMGFFCVRNS